MPKYFITAPRYINGKFYHANELNPAIVDLPEKDPATGKPYKIDKGLRPVDQGEPEKPAMHFSPSANGSSMAQHPHSTPIEDLKPEQRVTLPGPDGTPVGVPVAPSAPVVDSVPEAPKAESKRASDKKVI